jgi:hypothetical protein
MNIHLLLFHPGLETLSKETSTHRAGKREGSARARESERAREREREREREHSCVIGDALFVLLLREKQEEEAQGNKLTMAGMAATLLAPALTAVALGSVGISQTSVANKPSPPVSLSFSGASKVMCSCFPPLPFPTPLGAFLTAAYENQIAKKTERQRGGGARVVDSFVEGRSFLFRVF